MKKKIIALVLIGTILSVIIYFFTQKNEITLVALGDGLSLGMTPYNIEGYSYNDYLKEDYLNKHELKSYIHEFADKGKTIKEAKNEKRQAAVNRLVILAQVIILNEEDLRYLCKVLEKEETLENIATKEIINNINVAPIYCGVNALNGNNP